MLNSDVLCNQLIMPLAITGGVYGACGIASDKLLCPKLPEDSLSVLNDKVIDALVHSGLKEKGCKIGYVKSDGTKKPNFWRKLFPKSKLEFVGFAPKDNIIVYSKEIPLAAFHEIGHAIDYKLGNPFIKILLKFNGMTKYLIPALILGSALLGVTVETKENKNKNKKDDKTYKTLKFIQNNIGKISALVMSPMLITEVTASIKANKLAKMSGVEKGLIKRMNLGLFMAFGTYACIAAFTVIAAKVFSKAYKEISSRFKKTKTSENMQFSNELKNSQQIIPKIFSKFQSS